MDVVFADTWSSPCVVYKAFAIFRHEVSWLVWMRIGGIRSVFVLFAVGFPDSSTDGERDVGVGERDVDVSLLVQLPLEFKDLDVGVGDFGSGRWVPELICVLRCLSCIGVGMSVFFRLVLCLPLPPRWFPIAVDS